MRGNKVMGVAKKPSAEKHCVLLDSGSEAGILRKSQQSSDCCDAQSNETPRAKVAEVAAGKRMLELKNKKDTGIHKKGNPKTDSESGRSMVEMLGVLAIMGVLAIGGIAGYRWAMDKYRSNDTIKELSERAVVYSQQMIREAKTLSSAEFNPADRTRLGYGLTAEVLTEAPKFFEIGLTDVPQRVCQNIMNETWLLPVSMSANGISNETGEVTCDNELNAMAFVFHRDLSNEDLIEGTADAEETTTSSEEICDPTGQCCGETPLLGGGSKCYPCDYSGNINVGNAGGMYGNCEICDGRNGRTKRYIAYGRDFYFYSCVLAENCPSNTIPDDISGYCKCPEGYANTWRGCLKCADIVYEDWWEEGKGIPTYSALEDSDCTMCGATKWKTKAGSVWCRKE